MTPLEVDATARAIQVVLRFDGGAGPSLSVLIAREIKAAVLAERGDRDAVFQAVVDFVEHERGCVECGGELHAGVIAARLRYLCPKGRELLAWWSR